MMRWSGVTLAPDGLHVHSLRSPTIRWQDIAALSTHRVMGTTIVVVWETSGRSTRLRFPMTGLLAWDRDFGAKFHTMVAWHEALRGPVDPR